MKFTFIQNDNNPNNEGSAESCKAAIIVKMLYNTKQFQYDRFVTGNCFQVALELLMTIAESGLPTDGWIYAIGECPPPQLTHAWLEYDGWAVDFSNGDSFFALTEDYLELKKAVDVERYTFKTIQIYMQSAECRKKLGFRE